MGRNGKNKSKNNQRCAQGKFTVNPKQYFQFVIGTNIILLSTGVNNSRKQLHKRSLIMKSMSLSGCY